MLGGMAALPGPDWQDIPLEAPAIAQVRHVFTHFTLELDVFSATTGDRPVPAGHRWAAADRLHEEGLPTVMKKVVEAAMGSPEIGARSLRSN